MKSHYVTKNISLLTKSVFKEMHWFSRKQFLVNGMSLYYEVSLILRKSLYYYENIICLRKSIISPRMINLSRGVRARRRSHWQWDWSHWLQESIPRKHGWMENGIEGLSSFITHNNPGHAAWKALHGRILVIANAALRQRICKRQ